MLQQGLVDLGFIGGAEVDRFGNLNTDYVGDWRAPAVRPARLRRREATSRPSRERFVVMHAAGEASVPRSALSSSPRPASGAGRAGGSIGLPGGGPSGGDHDAGVFRFDPLTAEMLSRLLPSGAERRRCACGDRLGAPRGARRARDADAEPAEELASCGLRPAGLLDPLMTLATAGPAPATGRARHDRSYAAFPSSCSSSPSCTAWPAA